MSHKDLNQESLRCRLVQLWSCLLNEEMSEGSGSYRARHLETCACCRRLLEEGRALERALGQTAKRGQPGIPVGMEQRILNAVRRDRSPSPSRRIWVMGVSVAGAVALAALALVSTRWIAAPQATPPVLQANASHAIEEMWDRIQPSTDAILDAAPLQNEVDAVYSDARSAIGFLALNFLPSTSESIQKAGIIP